jgi:hypothetical protein
MANPQSTTGVPANRQNASPNDPNLYLSRSMFTYEADTLTNYPNGLAPSNQAVMTFNIAKDSDFFWTKFNCFATIAADGVEVSTEPLAGMNITIINVTNGRQYMNNPVPIPNLTGSGRLPFILPVATLWEALTTIQITLQNVTDDTTYTNVQLSFIGIKAFFKQ